MPMLETTIDVAAPGGSSLYAGLTPDVPLVREAVANGWAVIDHRWTTEKNCRVTLRRDEPNVRVVQIDELIDEGIRKACAAIDIRTPDEKAKDAAHMAKVRGACAAGLTMKDGKLVVLDPVVIDRENAAACAGVIGEPLAQAIAAAPPVEESRFYAMERAELAHDVLSVSVGSDGIAHVDLYNDGIARVADSYQLIGVLEHAIDLLRGNNPRKGTVRRHYADDAPVGDAAARRAWGLPNVRGQA